MVIEKKYYRIFDLGKWFFSIGFWKSVKDTLPTKINVPFYFSIGYGRLTNVLTSGVWFHFSLFNLNIDEAGPLRGIHISIPIRKYKFV